MARRNIPQTQLNDYLSFRQTMSRTNAARLAGISVPTAKKVDDGHPVQVETMMVPMSTVIANAPLKPVTETTRQPSIQHQPTRDERYDKRYEGDDLPDPMDLTDDTYMSAEGKRGLEDFAYWRRRYLGRLSTPWQEEAAYDIIKLAATPDKEYAVVNAPPGSGKSTLFTHDIPAWLICRRRSLRVIIGSRTEKQAKSYVGRLRRTFDRRRPIKADPEELALELAVNAEAVLVQDYGRFRPLIADLWRYEEFVVAQAGDETPDDKEPTAAAYGMDSGFLGMRANVVIWDDLADAKTMRTVEARENIREWWDDTAERRLEPGGVLILQGQRMGPEDIYRYALDMVEGGDEDDEGEDDDTSFDPWSLVDEDEQGNPIRTRKYHHVIYQAHDETRCTGRHKKTDPYWPDNCLLDPRRLPWRELRTIKANKANKFRVLYQQEDVDPDTVLVDPVWVSGGIGRDGEMHPGCWDNDRGLCELPKGLSGQLLSIATADPSPTKYWALQWWVVRIDEDGPQERYLMDLVKDTMEAPDFLDWNNDNQAFTGTMEEWQFRSIQLGFPIKAWIVEANAAQRFMLQYEHVKRWMAKRGVSIYPHQTHLNKGKEAEEYGVETIAPHWKFGRVRLPGAQKGRARFTSLKLVEEVTKWPEGKTDDQVMAEWFLEWRLPMLYSRAGGLPVARRASWMKTMPNAHQVLQTPLPHARVGAGGR